MVLTFPNGLRVYVKAGLETMAMTKELDRNQRGKQFEQVLLEAIDEALSCLGAKVKGSIYFHLEQQFKIKRHEIPYRLDDFSDSLERIFGLGARQLEILFMKNLHAKVGGLIKWEGPRRLVPDLKFLEYVKLMKLSCEDPRRIEEVEVLINAEEQQGPFT
jgi:hypothetical protein